MLLFSSMDIFFFGLIKYSPCGPMRNNSHFESDEKVDNCNETLVNVKKKYLDVRKESLIHLDLVVLYWRMRKMRFKAPSKYTGIL